MNFLIFLTKFFKKILFVKSFFLITITIMLVNYILSNFFYFWNIEIYSLYLSGILLYILIFYTIKYILIFFKLYNNFILSLLLLFFLIKYFFIDLIFIQGESMEPTIRNPSIGIVNKFSYGIEIPYFVFPFGNVGYKKICPPYYCKINNLKNSDIVVFDFPDPVLKKRKWIKRIVGLPGDKYEFKNSQLFINNKKSLLYNSIEFLPENHNTFIFELPKELRTYPKEIQYFFLYGIGIEGIVLENSILVLGDNTKTSRDSRIFGFIPKNRILGKLIYVFP